MSDPAPPTLLPGVAPALPAGRRPAPAGRPRRGAADPRQGDLFGPDVAPPDPEDAPVRLLQPAAGMAVPPAPEAQPPACPAPGLAEAQEPAPLAATPETPEPPALRRADPLAFRPKDRPDDWLYHVTTGEAADPLLRHGLPADATAALLERDAVAARLATLADELGSEAERPGALAVLRLRRHAVRDRLRAAPGGGWVLTDSTPAREATP